MNRAITSVALATTLVSAVFAAQPANADLYTFPGFSSGLSFAGDAAVVATGDGSVLRVTSANYNEAGAAYSTSPITLGAASTFSTQFQFRFTQPGGVDPADGITFVLAASPSGLGGSGFGMGYYGVPNSLAIEFDTYNNGNVDSDGFFAAEPDSSNHVAIDTDGVLTNTAATNVYNNGSCGFSGGTPPQNNYLVPGCMSNGDLWTAIISYDGSLLNVTLTDPAEGTVFDAITNYAIDIGSYLGTNTAYVGFTASSGAGFENHDIVNWEFANTTELAAPPAASGVPEPITLSVFGAGLAGAAAMRRRKAKRA